MQEKTFHRVILKSTGIFGIAHLVKIVTKIVTNKIAAIYLGAIGIGIIGIVENLLSILFGLVNFGLSSSSVREIALLSNDDVTSKAKEARMIKVIYYWSLFSGVLGFLIFILTTYSFFQNTYPKDSSYFWFLTLGFYFVFFALFSTRMAVLQAKREIKKMVRIQIYSSISHMIIAVICYYFFGLNGIAMVILFATFFSFLFVYFGTKHIKMATETISVKQAFSEGLPMVKIGLILSVGAIINQVAFYVIRLFLKDFMSLESLGIFQVSYTILIGYLGIIFIVMSNDFYPQLCNLEKDKMIFEKYINEQTQLALYLVVPLVMLMYVIAPQLITLLYANTFIDVLLILQVALSGLILKTLAWPIGFISLVKGNKKLFFKQNLLSDIMNVVFSIVLTKYFGLKGLGIAFSLMFLASFCYNYYTVSKNYQFTYSKETKSTILISISFGIIALSSFHWFDFSYKNLIILVLFFLSVLFSFFKLKKQIRR